MYLSDEEILCEKAIKEIDKYYEISFDSPKNNMNIDEVRKHLEPYEKILIQYENIEIELTDEQKKELYKLIKEINKTKFYDMNEAHAIEHIEKVMLFSAILANNEKLSQEETKLLLIASAFHDSGRNGMDDESEHAEASAKETYKYLEENPVNPFGITKENVGLIQVIIHYHEYKEPVKGKVNEEEIKRLCKKYGVSNYNFESIIKICELLKDSDALDRARFGLRGQTFDSLDTKYLHSKTSKTINMIKYAENLNLNLSRKTAVECYGLKEFENYTESVLALSQPKVMGRHLEFNERMKEYRIF